MKQPAVPLPQSEQPGPVKRRRTSAIPPDLRVPRLFLLLADAGLRPGEACGVQWANFDATAQTLLVERAVTNSGRIKTTKTGEARTVDLSSRLVSALTDLRSHLEAEAVLAGKEAIGPWIFENVGGRGANAGQPIRPRLVGKLFGWVVRTAALPHFVLYDLRHSFASHLIASGATIDYVSKQLGHASPVMTLSVYTHFFPKGDRRHVERMEQIRSAAVAEWAPAAHDNEGLLLVAGSVNEDSWHRFSTAVEDRETGESEVLDFSGAEGGIRLDLLRHFPPSAGFSLILLDASSTWLLEVVGTE